MRFRPPRGSPFAELHDATRASLVSASPGELARGREFRHDTVVAGARQGLSNRRVIARPTRDFDAGIVGKQRSSGKQAYDPPRAK
jgi:hypothetical protein